MPGYTLPRSAVRISLSLTIPLLILLFLNLVQSYVYGSPGTDDFIEYWTAGQLLRAGESPYHFNKLYQLQLTLGSPYAAPIIMWNPPWLLIWIFPLLLLAFPVAGIVWLALNCGLILGSGTLGWRTLAGPSASRQIGIAWVATIAFVPALFTLRMGQMSTVVLLGVAGFLYFASQDRDYLAGMCLALTTIKPHVVYLLWLAVVWWVVTERRWKVVAGMTGLLVPTLAVLTLVWPGWFAGYQTALARPPLYWGTPTLGGLLRLLFFTDWSKAQFLAPVVVSLLFAGYLIKERPSFHWNTAVSPLLLISIPTAAYGWTFDQIVLLIPYLQIIAWLVEDRQVNQHQKSVSKDCSSTRPRARLLARDGPLSGIFRHSHKAHVMIGLLLIFGLMVTENLLRMNELFFFWAPWALAGVYLYARAHHDPAYVPRHLRLSLPSVD